MNHTIPHRARSLVSAILAFSLGLSTVALARPQTPYENGTREATNCWQENDVTSGRSDYECCRAKANALYPDPDANGGHTNLGANSDFRLACYRQVDFLASHPTLD